MAESPRICNKMELFDLGQILFFCILFTSIVSGTRALNLHYGADVEKMKCCSVVEGLSTTVNWTTVLGNKQISSKLLCLDVIPTLFYKVSKTSMIVENL